MHARRKHSPHGFPNRYHSLLSVLHPLACQPASKWDFELGGKDYLAVPPPHAYIRGIMPHYARIICIKENLKYLYLAPVLCSTVVHNMR